MTSPMTRLLGAGMAALLAAFLSLGTAVGAGAYPVEAPSAAAPPAATAPVLAATAPPAAAAPVLAATAPVSGQPRSRPAAVDAARGASGNRALVSASQLRQRPFSGVILVTVGDRVVCTGFVVAPRKVITAAHCLTRDASRGDFRFRNDLPGSVRLVRGFSEITGGSSFQTCGVARAWAPFEFVRSGARDRLYGSRAHDYAVLTTTPDCVYPRSAALRLWATTPADGELPAGSGIKLVGYPADARFSDMTGLNLWRSRGQVRSGDNDPRLIDTTGFVAQGMSGGPIWAAFGAGSPCGRSQCVVGILTECAVNARGQCKLGDSLRRAVRITPEVRAALDER